MSIINNVSVNALGKLMDGLWQRQQAISDNVANIDTPNYRRKTVSFEQELAKALNNENKNYINKKIKDITIETKQQDDFFYTADNNGVDVDKENLELATTTLQYQYAVRMLNDNFSRLKYAVNEGRR